MTVRQALDDLVAEGRLDRQQGRGTFVARPKIGQQLIATSFSEDMRRRGLVPGGRTLSVALVLAGARIGRHLEVSPSEAVLKLVRLRLADDEPMAIETLHAPERCVPGLTGDALENRSFYRLLEESYGIRLAGGTQTVEATVTNDEESRLLEVPLHSPAFLFERVTRSSDGHPVEYVRSIYRGDRYRILTDLTRPGRATGRVPRRVPAVEPTP